MKSHHGQMHDESIAGVQTTCDYCGKEYRARTDGFARFCSNACQGKSERERVYFECEVCGDEFDVKPCAADSARTCSEECHLVWFSQWVSEHNDTGEDNRFWGGGTVTLNCEICGDEFEAKSSLADSRRFCSEECTGVWLETAVKGEGNPAWRGGYEGYYGPNWQSQRHRALERDEYKCQGCGMGMSTHVEKYDVGLHVHHITPAREFDDYEKQNAIENLVTLCAVCHKTREATPDT